MGETIVFASAKDGVGKTVLATNTAAILANWGYKTLLIDMNVGFRNSDVRLGLENEVVYDFADVINGICRIRQAILQHRKIQNLFFIASPQSEEKAEISDVAFQALLFELKSVFDYIIIDSPCPNSSIFTLAVNGGDKHLLVMNPEYGFIRDAELLKQRLKNLGKRSISIVVNKEFTDITEEGLTPHKEEISDLLGLAILGIIPFSKSLHKWANKGQPMAGVRNLGEPELKLIKSLELVCHELISKVDNLTPYTDV